MSFEVGYLEKMLEDARAELATERKRRETVEDYWYAEQKAHTAAVTRAEQAEREREEARADRDLMEKQWRDAVDVANRNAAEAEQAEARAEMWSTRAAERNEALETALVRAEQAERERDEARRLHGKAILDGSAAVSRAERAEADSAALLEAYRRTWSVVQHDNVLHSPACNASEDALGICTPECPALYVASMLKADHPGAAMLERMRALEEAATKASAELRHTYRPETRDWNLVARAITILEKVTTPGAPQ